MRQTAVYPTARQYEYVKVQEGVTSSAGFAGVGVRFWQSDTKQDWYRANGSGRERIVNSREGFFAPLDRSIARAHGLSLAQYMPNQDGDLAYPGVGAYYSDYDPAGLPTQPTALLRAIEREVRDTRTPPTATAGATVSEVATASVFEVIADRLLFASTSPALRSALYRVIAHLPGVELLGGGPIGSDGAESRWRSHTQRSATRPPAGSCCSTPPPASRSRHSWSRRHP